MIPEGKTTIVTKVFEESCELCKHMSKHDRATFEAFDPIVYQELPLDDVVNHGDSLTKLRLYQCLERHAVNADYTIDLPVYVFLSRVGEYKGHYQGAGTVVELRDKIKECLEDTPSQE